MSRCKARWDEEPGRCEFSDGDEGDKSDYGLSSPAQGEGPDCSAEELEAQVYEGVLAEESRNSEYACCECGFVKARGDGHHRGGRCPHTGRCGWCGGRWPCVEHGPEGRKK